MQLMSLAKVSIRQEALNKVSNNAKFVTVIDAMYDVHIHVRHSKIWILCTYDALLNLFVGALLGILRINV